MHRKISADNPVRRCLFPPTGDEEGQADNHVNGFVEVMEKELEEKKQKWHYDFENDAPMIGKGRVAWRDENGKWIGEIQNDDEPDKMENKTVETEAKTEEAKIKDVKMQNEETPHPTPVKEVAPPPVRKRSREDGSPTDIRAKRKL
ncbi:hypothetical protein ABMA27_003302 [Loxostege sticticalis]|uniref:Cyclin-dependent kinase inhibitor domain-containing protein n=1 Tax=Loxostege sticticalis TaxID=481309 RepID=A0ABR3HSU3_LOXSC